jgi:hypothetical protein
VSRVRAAVAAGTALLVGTAAGAGVPAPGARDAAAPAPVPVVGTSALCPDVRGPVLAGLAADAPADVTARPLDGAAAPVPLAVRPGSAAEVPTQDAVQVTAAGEGAAGLSVQASALVAAGAVRGLATDLCGPASTESWLVGGGTVVGESGVLLLANPDGEDAVVDVTVLSAEGPVDDRPGRGLSVPARGRLALPLDELAPERSRLALRVQATTGRVAAAVRVERSDGVVPRGVDVAARTGPGEELVVPGLPAGPGGRGLVLANPAPTTVTARVEVTALDGQFVPEGLEAVEVPAQSTAAVDLTGVLAATPAAVRVTADGPLVAAGTAEDAGEGDVRDTASWAAVPSLAGPVLVPDVALGAGEAVVLLSALTGDAVAEVAVLPAPGGPAVAVPPRRVDVPGGRTVAVDVASLVPAGTAGRVAVRVAPDDVASPVHAGLVLRARPAEGPLLAGVALASGPREVPRPRVVRDPAVAVRP